MRSEDFRDYWKPARDRCLPITKNAGDYLSTNVDASIKLASLLGLSYHTPGDWSFIELTEELKAQLQAIVGPYSNAVIKILEIRAKDGAST